MDRIDRLKSANIGVARAPKGYAVEAVVPLALVGRKPEPGNRYKIDFGILNADSRRERQRLCALNGLIRPPAWSVMFPVKIMPTPNLWGVAALAGEKSP